MARDQQIELISRNDTVFTQEELEEYIVTIRGEDNVDICEVHCKILQMPWLYNAWKVQEESGMLTLIKNLEEADKKLYTQEILQILFSSVWSDYKRQIQSKVLLPFVIDVALFTYFCILITDGD